MRAAFLGAAILLACASCAEPPPGEGRPDTGVAPALDYAIAIHGGAGVPKDSLDAEEQREYRDRLAEALRLGEGVLREGGTSLDAVEQVLRMLEDEPLFNAGRGAVLTRDGRVELDASIMNGASLACGAVTGVLTVRHPISLARRVMEGTGHVLLAGEGAERFAEKTHAARVDPGWFITPRRREALRRRLSEEDRPEPGGGTVGTVARDRYGNLAAGTSTGGLTAKLPGRVGDSPIIGAGTYADNRTCAVSCSGKGEEFIRRSVAYRVAALMELRGLSVAEAVERVVLEELEPGDGGLIAVDASGNIAMVFNTAGMFRGAADSAGRFEVHIW